MKTAALVFGLVMSITAVGYAQLAPTITNATLEKYQQKRLAAERDYRENYERLGFPSPEELDRQREVDMETRLELAQQLRQARLEKERLELEQQSLNLEAARLDRDTEMAETTGYYGGYQQAFGGFGRYGGYGYGGYGYGGRGFGAFPGLYPMRGYPRNWLLPQQGGGNLIATPYGTIRDPRSMGSFPGLVFPGRAIRGRRR